MPSDETVDRLIGEGLRSTNQDYCPFSLTSSFLRREPMNLMRCLSFCVLIPLSLRENLNDVHRRSEGRQNHPKACTVPSLHPILQDQW